MSVTSRNRTLATAPYVFIIALLANTGCSDSARPNIVLPPTTDLYAYSVAVAERARARVPEDRALAVFNLARVHERFGREESALPLFEESLRLDPTNSTAYKAMGRFYSLTGRSEKAIQAYQLALRHEPNSSGLWTQIALVLIHLGKFDEALERLDTEVRLATATPVTYFNIGLAQKSLENWDAAAAAYRKALELDENMPEALHGLSEALRLIGKHEERKPIHARWLEIKKVADKLELEQKAAKTDEAAQRRWTADSWYDAAGVFIGEHNLIVTSGADHDRKRALEYRLECLAALDQALEFHPAHDGALTLKLDIISRTGSADDLLAARTAAAAARPNDVQLSISVARSHLQRASQIGRTDRKAYLEEVQKARVLLEGVVKRAPEHGIACGMLAEIYVKNFARDPRIAQRAVSLARQALKTMTTPNANIYDILAGALNAIGQPQEARKAFVDGIANVPADQRPQLQQRLDQLDQMLRSRGEQR